MLSIIGEAEGGADGLGALVLLLVGAVGEGEVAALDSREEATEIAGTQVQRVLDGWQAFDEDEIGALEVHGAARHGLQAVVIAAGGANQATGVEGEAAGGAGPSEMQRARVAQLADQLHDGEQAVACESAFQLDHRRPLGRGMRGTTQVGGYRTCRAGGVELKREHG